MNKLYTRIQQEIWDCEVALGGLRERKEFSDDPFLDEEIEFLKDQLEMLKEELEQT